MMQSLFVGCLVHYVMPESGHCRPMLVTRRHQAPPSDYLSMVNGALFADKSEDGEKWPVACAMQNVPHDPEGGERTWHWPSNCIPPKGMSA